MTGNQSLDSLWITYKRLGL